MKKLHRLLVQLFARRAPRARQAAPRPRRCQVLRCRFFSSPQEPEGRQRLASAEEWDRYWAELRAQWLPKSPPGK